MPKLKIPAPPQPPVQLPPQLPVGSTTITTAATTIATVGPTVTVTAKSTVAATASAPPPARPAATAAVVTAATAQSDATGTTSQGHTGDEYHSSRDEYDYDYDDEGHDDEDDLEAELHAMQMGGVFDNIGRAIGGGGAGGGGGGGGGGGKSLSMSSRTSNDVAAAQRNRDRGTTKYQGRDDRATNEQVLDPRTRMILYKMLNRGFLQELDGCISTGKEANVYHASGEGGVEYAVKVYKTSILVFKDRAKYVEGEFRWRHGYCKKNI